MSLTFNDVGLRWGCAAEVNAAALPTPQAHPQQVHPRHRCEEFRAAGQDCWDFRLHRGVDDEAGGEGEGPEPGG